MHTLHMLDILPLIDIAQPPPGARSYNIPCPCCDHAPRKRHLNINLEKDVFRCPRCGFSGGIFDLYSYYTGIPRHGIRSTLLSRLPFSASNLPKQPVARNEVPLCPIEQRSETYQAFLSHLSLASDHWESLLSRGLSPEEILRLGYKTTPSASTKLLASHLLSSGYCLQGVPGFYQTAAGWTLIPQHRGILIPVRDLHGRIQGLQIRCDSTSHRKFRWLSSINRKSGCKAESWVHMSGAPKDIVLLTEGAMKADIIHAFTGQTVLAVAGINALSSLEEVLVDLQQRGTQKIMIAFDMDFLSNPHVQTGYCHLTELLSTLGFCYGTYLWDPHYKGLDDYLQNFRPNSFPTPVTPPVFDNIP